MLANSSSINSSRSQQQTFGRDSRDSPRLFASAPLNCSLFEISPPCARSRSRPRVVLLQPSYLDNVRATLPPLLLCQLETRVTRGRAGQNKAPIAPKAPSTAVFPFPHSQIAAFFAQFILKGASLSSRSSITFFLFYSSLLEPIFQEQASFRCL